MLALLKLRVGGKMGKPAQGDRVLLKRIFTRENVFAFVLCLVLILLVIVTADTAPRWIYQGF